MGGGSGLFATQALGKHMCLGLYTGRTSYKRPPGDLHSVSVNPTGSVIIQGDPAHDLLANINEPPRDRCANVWLEHVHLDVGGIEMYSAVLLTANAVGSGQELLMNYGSSYESVRRTEGYVAGHMPVSERPTEADSEKSLIDFACSANLDLSEAFLCYGAVEDTEQDLTQEVNLRKRECMACNKAACVSS
jgi:hypothetical protein